MAVSKRLRYEILRRDNHTCRYCGATAPGVPLRVDHVTPVALGGTDEPTNLVTSCEPCNNGKSSASPDAALVADVSDDALRWAAAMEQAAENLREQQKPKDEYRDAFLAEWNRWHVGKDDTKKVPLDDDWKQSIERFRVAGIPVWMWVDIVDIGMANKKVTPKNTFRYCCGIAWNKVTELQGEARRIVGAEPSTSSRLDTDDVDALATETALLVWGQEWALSSKGPTHEQVQEFRSTAREAISSGVELHELIEAAPYGAWFSTADAREAVQHFKANSEFIEQQVAWSVFTHAWAYSRGEHPPAEATARLWERCEKLYELGAHPVEVTLAAAAAGLNGTTRMHVGLGVEGLNAIGSLPGPLHAEQAWASAWQNNAIRILPTDDDREAFRASLERVRSRKRHTYSDVYAAATSAGTYRDTDLDFHLPCKGSALAAAALLPGGEN